MQLHFCSYISCTFQLHLHFYISAAAFLQLHFFIYATTSMHFCAYIYALLDFWIYAFLQLQFYISAKLAITLLYIYAFLHFCIGTTPQVQALGMTYDKLPENIVEIFTEGLRVDMVDYPGGDRTSDFRASVWCCRVAC
jgi:hypothetical protein